MYPIRARALGGKVMLAHPRMLDVPRVGSSNPRIMRIVVVLPAPLRPMKANTLPRGTEKETVSTAHLLPKYLVSPAVLMTASRVSDAVSTSENSERVMVYLQEDWFPMPGGLTSFPPLHVSRPP